MNTNIQNIENVDDLFSFFRKKREQILTLLETDPKTLVEQWRRSLLPMNPSCAQNKQKCRICKYLSSLQRKKETLICIEYGTYTGQCFVYDYKTLPSPIHLETDGERVLRGDRTSIHLLQTWYLHRMFPFVLIPIYYASICGVNELRCLSLYEKNISEMKEEQLTKEWIFAFLYQLIMILKVLGRFEWNLLHFRKSIDFHIRESKTTQYEREFPFTLVLSDLGESRIKLSKGLLCIPSKTTTIVVSPVTLPLEKANETRRLRVTREQLHYTIYTRTDREQPAFSSLLENYFILFQLGRLPFLERILSHLPIFTILELSSPIFSLSCASKMIFEDWIIENELSMDMIEILWNALQKNKIYF